MREFCAAESFWHMGAARERAKEGGATKPTKLDAAQQKRLLRLYQQGEPVSELITIFGISRSSLFRTLKVLKQREPMPSWLVSIKFEELSSCLPPGFDCDTTGFTLTHSRSSRWSR
jgi:Helix-turn-helix domain of resolvase